MRTLCLDVYHDGDKWIAKNDQITASGKTLKELDENIRDALRKVLKPRRRVKIKVAMELDYRRNVPHWIHQYHPYYFYRTVYLEL